MSDMTNRHDRIARAAKELADLDEEDRGIAVALAQVIAEAVAAALKAEDDDVPF